MFKNIFHRIKEHLNSDKGRELSAKLSVGMINAASAFVTELLFAFLPILILTVVRIYQGAGNNILEFPEWAFMAAVLFGQAIPRMFEILSEIERSFNPRTTSATASIVIVLGLIPSLLILVLMLLSEHPSGWLVFGQLFMCVLSVLTMFITTLARQLIDEGVELADILFPELVEQKRQQQDALPTKNPPN